MHLYDCSVWWNEEFHIESWSWSLIYATGERELSWRCAL